jgi:hypothetical protein
LKKAADSTQIAADAMRQSIKNKLAILGSAATEMGFKFVEAFKDKAVAAIESATKAIENFDVAPLVEMASAAADGIMKFVGMLIGAAKIAWQFRYVIVAIAAPIVAYNLLLMAATVGIGLFSKLSLIGTIVMGTQTTALAMLKKGTIEYLFVDKLFLAATKIKTILLMVLTKGTLTQSGALAAMAVANKTATVSQWLLNAAMNANPIGLVVLAIAVLIGIIVALVKWGHKAAAVFIIIAGVLLGPVAAAVGFIISAFVELIKGWGSVTKAFKDGGIIAGLKQIGALLLSGLLGPIQGLLELLAKIPGVGKLLEPAIKGLNDFRNKLKGIEAPVIEAEVKTPETEFDKLTKEFGIAMPEILDIDYPGFGIPGMGSVPGTGERSKLHGVVDISGGVVPAFDSEGPYTTTSAVDSASSPGTATAALTSYVIGIAATLQRIDASVSAIARSLPPAARAELSAINAPEIAARNVINIPMLPVSGKGPQTTDTAASTPPPPILAIPPTLTSNIIGITDTLQRIDASVSLISRSLPPAARAELPAIAAPGTATRTSLALPRVNMGGGDGPDYHNPRDISPVTQTERMAYSLEERRHTIVIEVAAEKGTAARIVRAPRDVDIQIVRSGGNA